MSAQVNIPTDPGVSFTPVGGPATFLVRNTGDVDIEGYMEGMHSGWPDATADPNTGFRLAAGKDIPLRAGKWAGAAGSPGVIHLRGVGGAGQAMVTKIATDL